MPMATWENYFFEEAIKQGHNVVSYHWPFNNADWTVEYEVDMAEMYQTNVNTGYKSKLIRLGSETDHTSPFLVEG